MQAGAGSRFVARVRGSAEGPLDYLLLPSTIHRHISRNASGLLGAFLLVGLFHTVFSVNLLRSGLFSVNPAQGLLRFLGLLVLTGLTGVIDVLCVILPVADFARFLAHRSERFISGGIRVILMKSYALSLLLFVIPASLLTYHRMDGNTLPATWDTGVQVEVAVLSAIMAMAPFLRLGILFRTLSIRSKLPLFPKVLVISALFCWMQVAGEATKGLMDLGFSLLLRIHG